MVDPGPEFAMEALLAYIGNIFTAIFGWVSGVVETIVNNPILLLTTGFLVVGGAIGIFGRLLSRR